MKPATKNRSEFKPSAALAGSLSFILGTIPGSQWDGKKPTGKCIDTAWGIPCYFCDNKGNAHCCHFCNAHKANNELSGSSAQMAG